MKSSTPDPFLSMLAVLFIGLKLTGHIAWSWWWVLAPVWGSFLIGAAVAVLALFYKVWREK